jgi:hypothetical protein
MSQPIDMTVLEASLMKPIDMSSIEASLTKSTIIIRPKKKKPLYSANLAYPSMFKNNKSHYFNQFK